MIDKLFIFDFDDTLVSTSSTINIDHGNGKTTRLTTSQYRTYVPNQHDILDFSELEYLTDPQEIRPMTNYLRRIINDHGQHCVFILSARHDDNPIYDFLEQAEIPLIDVIITGTSDPYAKAEEVALLIDRYGPNYIEFYDDRNDNLAAVNKLRHVYCNVEIICRNSI